MAKMYPHGKVVNGEFEGLNVYVWKENKSLMIVNGVIDNGLFAGVSTNKFELNDTTIKAYEDLGGVKENANPKAVSTATFWFGVGAGLLASQLGKQEVYNVVVQYTTGKLSMLQLNSWAYTNFKSIVFYVQKGIKREGKQNVAVNNTSPVQAQTHSILVNTSNIDASLKRIELFLEDGEWKTASDYCDAVLDIEPTNAQAYIYKLFTDLHVKNAEGLSAASGDYWENKNYQKAVRFGDEETTRAIREPAEHILRQRAAEAMRQQNEAALRKEREEAERKRKEQEKQNEQESFAGFWSRHAAEKERLLSQKARLSEKKEQLEERNKRTPQTNQKFLIDRQLRTIEDILKKSRAAYADFTGAEAEFLNQQQSVWDELAKLDEADRILRKKKTRNLIVALTIGVAVSICIFVYTAVIVPANQAKLAQQKAEQEYKLAEQEYKLAELDLANGKIAQAALEYGKHPDYKDSFDKAFHLFRQLNETDGRFDARDIEVVAVSSDHMVLYSQYSDDEIYDPQFFSWTGVSEVGVGNYHVAALLGDGTVKAAYTYKNFHEGETDVESWTNIKAIVTGWNRTVGIKSDGTVVAAGPNDKGQCNVFNWTDIVSVAAGAYYTVGLRSDGSVVATGDNSEGQCNVSDWRNIVAIAAGNNQAIGLKADGTVVFTKWEKGLSYGQDLSSWNNIISISATSSGVAGIKSDGTVVATLEFIKNFYGTGLSGIAAWTDIVSIRCNEQTIWGLKSDGTMVTTSDTDFAKKATAWSILK